MFLKYLLIVALAALYTAHHGLVYCSARSDQLVHLLHLFVVSVAFDVDLSTFVALDTPFHSNRRVLINFFHSFNRAVASLAF